MHDDARQPGSNATFFIPHTLERLELTGKSTTQTDERKLSEELSQKRSVFFPTTLLPGVCYHESKSQIEFCHKKAILHQAGITSVQNMLLEAEWRSPSLSSSAFYGKLPSKVSLLGQVHLYYNDMRSYPSSQIKQLDPWLRRRFQNKRHSRRGAALETLYYQTHFFMLLKKRQRHVLTCQPYVLHIIHFITEKSLLTFLILIN